MSQKVLLPKNVDTSKIGFGDLKTLDNGAKLVYVNLDNKPFIVQTPMDLTTPFGLSKYDDGKPSAEREKWTVQIALKDIDTNPFVGDFYKMLKELDTLIVDAGVEKSKLWFKKQIAKEVLNELSTSLVIYPKDKVTGEITDKYPPMFRLSVPMINGKIACDCFNANKEKVSLDTIEKGSKITAIIQFSNVWIAGTKFGCSAKVIQLRVVEPTGFSGYAFMPEDDDQQQRIESSDDEDDIPDPTADDEIECIKK